MRTILARLLALFRRPAVEPLPMSKSERARFELECPSYQATRPEAPSFY